MPASGHGEGITKTALLLNRLAESAAGARYASLASISAHAAQLLSPCPLLIVHPSYPLKTNPTQILAGFVNNLRATSQWCPQVVAVDPPILTGR